MIKKFEKFSKTDYLDLVDNVIKSDVGGRKFFNKIDKLIKEDPDTIKEICKGLSSEWIVSSGSFGDRLYDIFSRGEIKCRGIIVFNGKILTKNKGVNSYYPESFDLDNKTFVFVDDSIFSGKTLNEIERYLIQEHNSKISKIRVGYDGSKLDRRIESLYKYW